MLRLVPLALLGLASCFPFGQLQHARTLPADETCFAFGSNFTVVEDEEAPGSYLPYFGSVDLAFRHGVSEALTVGGRFSVGLISALEVDAELNLLRAGDAFWFTLGAYAGVASTLTFSGDRAAWLLGRALATARLGGTFAWTVTGTLGTAASDEQGPARYGVATGPTLLDVEGDLDMTLLVTTDWWGDGPPAYGLSVGIDLH